MDTPQQVEEPQSGSLLNRPVKPLVAVVISLVAFVLFFVLLFPYHPMRKAEEATLRENLDYIRTSIEQFHADTGHYPLVLTDLAAPDAQHLRTQVKKGSYQGPYLSTPGGVNNLGVPLNPLAHVAWEGPSTEDLVNRNWRYDAKTGQVHSAVTGTTLDGKRYEDL